MFLVQISGFPLPLLQIRIKIQRRCRISKYQTVDFSRVIVFPQMPQVTCKRHWSEKFHNNFPPYVFTSLPCVCIVCIRWTISCLRTEQQIRHHCFHFHFLMVGFILHVHLVFLFLHLKIMCAWSHFHTLLWKSGSSCTPLSYIESAWNGVSLSVTLKLWSGWPDKVRKILIWSNALPADTHNPVSYLIVNCFFFDVELDEGF